MDTNYVGVVAGVAVVGASVWWTVDAWITSRAVKKKTEELNGIMKDIETMCGVGDERNDR